MPKIKYPEDKIKEAIAIAEKAGAKKASRETGIPAGTIRSWLHRGKKEKPKQHDPAEVVSQTEDDSELPKLTKKQKMFIQEYLVDLNGTQAAIRAGYSENCARQIANENMSKPYIRQAIDEAVKEREKRTQVNQDVVIGELAKIALTDIKNYLAFRTEKTQVGTNDDGTPIIDYAHVVDIKDSDQVDGSVISEVQLNKDGTFKFKLHDKKGALELLGKHLKLFTDKVEHGGGVEIEHDVSDDAIRAAANLLFERRTGVKASDD